MRIAAWLPLVAGLFLLGAAACGGGETPAGGDTATPTPTAPGSDAPASTTPGDSATPAATVPVAEQPEELTTVYFVHADW